MAACMAGHLLSCISLRRSAGSRHGFPKPASLHLACRVSEKIEESKARAKALIQDLQCGLVILESVRTRSSTRPQGSNWPYPR